MPAPIRPERSDRGGNGVQRPNKLAAEVRQSISLLFITALTLLASIGVGVLAGQLG